MRCYWGFSFVRKRRTGEHELRADINVCEIHILLSLKGVSVFVVLRSRVTAVAVGVGSDKLFLYTKIKQALRTTRHLLLLTIQA